MATFRLDQPGQLSLTIAVLVCYRASCVIDTTPRELGQLSFQLDLGPAHLPFSIYAPYGGLVQRARAKAAILFVRSERTWPERDRWGSLPPRSLLIFGNVA
jgi:hypothetical protein